MRGELSVLRDRPALAERAARVVAQRLAAAVEARGTASLVLAGGTTPRELYHRLALPPFVKQIPWAELDILWSDERAVPPDHPESNYRLAQTALLAHVPLRPERIHRIPGELPPAEAARRYEREIRHAFGLDAGELPRFDLVLLGVGSDGHTASLFPRTAALSTTDQLAAANWVPRLGAQRVTLTFPALNHAAAVLVLVAGADKAEALARVLEGGEAIDDCPARGIAPEAGKLLWLVDEAAASRLAEKG